MHSTTLRFLASQTTLPQAGRIPGGTVLRWVDEAGFACASAWAKGACITEFVGGAHFVRAIRPGDLVEVHARLAYTSDSSMCLAVEVRSGGVQGGITNGEPVYFRVAFKPTATVMREQATVSVAGEDTTITGRGRHDPCVLPRAVPMVEAMAALVLVDHALRHEALRPR